MAAWSDFIPLIAPDTPGAADIVIESAARQAAIEFLGESLALQRTLSSVPAVGSQAAYTLTQSGEVCEKLLSVKVAGAALTLLPPQELDSMGDLTAGTPVSVCLTGPMQITLYPAPSASGASIVVRAAMRPSQAATALADDVFERYARVIADLAVSRLAGAHDRPYSNRGVASAAQARYQAALDASRPKVFRGHARAYRRGGSAGMTWC